jgi:hypothetical protein
MRNIERGCITAPNASINDAFKVSNDPTIQGWHAGMCVIEILDQFSQIYGQPTPGVLELNSTVFHSLYMATNAPEVLFQCIEKCTKTALLGCNPNIDRQLITNTIYLLLTTGLYIWAFKEWGRLLPAT